MFDQLALANQFIRQFSLPADGDRQLKTDSYSGVLTPDMIQEVTKKTTYLSWSEIRRGARQLVSHYQPEGDYWIFLPNGTIGSELVLLSETWDIWLKNFYLPTGFLSDVKSKCPKTMTVVILDDWALTGQSKTGIMDELQYYNPETKFTFHLLIPFVSEDSQVLMKQVCPTVQIYTTDPNWNPKDLSVPLEWYRENISEENTEEMGQENVMCVYSDIKIPDAFCCPRKFYLSSVTPAPFNIKQELQQFFPDLTSTKM